MAPRVEVPGYKIKFQQFWVLGVYRPLRPKSAIPHPITIQNMRFERQKKLWTIPLSIVRREFLFDLIWDQRGIGSRGQRPQKPVVPLKYFYQNIPFKPGARILGCPFSPPTHMVMRDPHYQPTHQPPTHHPLSKSFLLQQPCVGVTVQPLFCPANRFDVNIWPK